MPIGDNSQYPVRGVGPQGQDERIGFATLVSAGQGTPGFGTWSGVGTCYGIPGVSVPTRVATGVYAVKFPPTKGVMVIPSIQTPSGIDGLSVSVRGAQAVGGTGASNVGGAAVNGMFGFLHLSISAPVLGAATVLRQNVNPPTGTVVQLLFFASPTRAF